MISVIVPAFNAEKYVAESLESILAQSHPADEVLVVDDGSTDGTLDVVASFGDKLRSISQTNQGIGPARNRGIEEARGDVLAFLDADDLWTPEKLALQTKSLASDPGLDLVFGSVQQFASPEMADAVNAKYQYIAEPMPGYLAPTMLARRTAFDRAGLFDAKWKVGEFVEWYLRAQDLGIRSRMLPEVVLHRRVHDSNTGIKQRDAKSDYVRIVKAAMDRRARARQKTADR